MIICLVFDVDPPEEEQQFDSWLGAAMAVGSAWAAANHEPTQKEQLMKPIKVISSKLVGCFPPGVTALFRWMTSW